MFFDFLSTFVLISSRKCSNFIKKKTAHGGSDTKALQFFIKFFVHKNRHFGHKISSPSFPDIIDFRRSRKSNFGKSLPRITTWGYLVGVKHSHSLWLMSFSFPRTSSVFMSSVRGDVGISCSHSLAR
jgi:hypothetical protein